MSVEHLTEVPPEGGHWVHGSVEPRHAQVCVWKPDGKVLSAVWVSPAFESRFAHHAELSAQALSRSAAIDAAWISDAAHPSDLAAALYLALQRARVWDCNTVVAHVRDAEAPLARVLPLAELNAKPAVRDGVPHMAAAQLLDVAIHHAARRVGSAAWEKLRPALVQEAVDTVRHWVSRFYRGSWARSIFDQTMTREQYVQSLSNMHHYVRQTTQHLGRAIANCEDRELRRHFIAHLNGEINHEITIENDLRHLGIDPEYLMRHRVPSPATKAFMAIQEATIAFYRDPMLLMACPLAAEGVTASMPSEFISKLRELVRSWGVEKPEKATSFLTSHTHTDGGDDGHWQATADMLSRYLIDESVQRRFLCTLRAAADCIERSCNGNIDDFPLFSGVA